MKTIFQYAVFFALVLFLHTPASGGAAQTTDGTANPPQPGFRAADSDARAIALADDVMTALGGRAAWDGTRHVSWVFFGGRIHYWDRTTGNVRIQNGDDLVLMNIHTHEGQAWKEGEPVTDPEPLAEMLEAGFAWWTNDAYWVFMPYKLKDTGVALQYGGRKSGEDGRPGQVIDMTFTGVGLTPDNRYEVLVDDETHLVSEWAFYADAEDGEPRFTMPWTDWQRFGKIMLPGGHGRGEDWKLAVYEVLPASVYDSPDPIAPN